MGLVPKIWTTSPTNVISRRHPSAAGGTEKKSETSMHHSDCGKRTVLIAQGNYSKIEDLYSKIPLVDMKNWDPNPAA